MSQVRQIPTIKAIKITLAMGKTVLNGVNTVNKHLQQLSAEAMNIHQQITSLNTENTSSFHNEASPLTISPTLEARQNAQILQQKALKLAQNSQLSLSETTQLLGAVTAHSYSTTNPQLIEQAWQPLKTANSLESAQKALNQFTQTLETGHQQLIVENLVLACTNASLKVGFTPLESSAKLVNGTVRLISTDDTGRSLVTEIQTNPDNDVSLATEIIGTSDRSCQDILDRFEEALQEQGVTYGESDKKFTGGICELETAKEFIRKRPTKQATSSKAKTPSKTAKKPNRSVSQRQIKQGF